MIETKDGHMFDVLEIQKYLYRVALRILGWRSIDTAPTDGATIIVLESMNLECWNVFQAQYINDKPFPGWRGIYIAKYVSYSEDVDPHYMPKPIVTSPDFWKPLPKAPKLYSLWAFKCNDIELKNEE